MTWPGGGGYSGMWSASSERGHRRGKSDGGPACVWCEGPLGSSPSDDDFCSQDCQRQWSADDG